MAQYLHEDNKDLPYRDWRSPENRMEGFLRWLKWRLKWNDLDHYCVNNTYRDAYGMDQEQKYWYSTIFGMTYQSEMAWIIFNYFPDFGKIEMADVERWNDDNYDRQLYARDTKYNKGRLPEMVASIKKVVEPYGSLTNFYEENICDSEHETFEKTFEAIMRFHKYGRMCSWITCQALYETANFPAAPNTMLATDSSNWSVRSGLMYLYGLDDKIEAKNKDLTLTSQDLELIEENEKDILKRSEEYLEGKHKKIVSSYLVESHLCQYKKLMLGGDYPGHSSSDHQSRAARLSEDWPEIDYSPFYKMVETEYHPNVRGADENRTLRHFTKKTGQMINMSTEFSDMPNMYKELGISTDLTSEAEPHKMKVLDQRISEYAAKQSSNEDIVEDKFLCNFF